MFPRRVFTAHTRQHVLARAQTDEQRKRHKPDTDTEVRRDLGEVGLVVVVPTVAVPVACRSPHRGRKGSRATEPSEPHPVVGQDQATAEDEQGVRQLHNGEVSQVAHVAQVRDYAQRREVPGELVDQREEQLDDDDAIDQTAQHFGAEDGVFFDQFGQVVEPAGYAEGEEGEA